MRIALSCLPFLLAFLSVVSAPFVPVRADDAFNSLKRMAIKPANQVTISNEWKLPAKSQGKQLDNGTLELVGNGQSNAWTSGSFAIEPLKLYRLQFKSRVVKDGTGNCTPCGFDFANYDYSSLSSSDQLKPVRPFFAFSNVGNETTHLRFGQWESSKTYQFGDIQVCPAMPVYAGVKSADTREGSLEGDYLQLGSGETIKSGTYRFNSLVSGESTNFDRALVSSSAWFNTNRWCLSDGQDVIYRFRLQPIRIGKDRDNILLSPIPFIEGKISVSLCHYISGRCVLEASLDGKEWKRLGSSESLDSAIRSSFNGETFGKQGRFDEFYVRIRAEKKDDKSGASFQFSNVAIEMKTDSQAFSGRGKTLFASLGGKTQSNLEAVPLFMTPRNQFVCALANRSDKPVDLCSIASVQVNGREKKSSRGDWDVQVVPLSGHSSATSLGANSSALVATRYNRITADQEHQFDFAFDRTFSLALEIPMFLLQNYTARIDGLKGTTANADLSWCQQDFKVPKDPQIVSYLPPKRIQMESARNDFESFQIVIQPDAKKGKKIAGLKATASSLTGPQGAKIPADHVELRYAYYHFVEVPTDRTSVTGYWPDALVPLDKGSDGRGAPIEIEPGTNLPVWVTVRIPTGIAAGTYHGQVTIRDADSLDITVPYELKVWDFDLPQKNQLETAFGLSEGTIARYHNLKTESDRRAVWEMYLENFSNHRISPYTPAPFDPIRTTWRPESKPPHVELDAKAFSSEMRRVFDKYHFTNFRCQVDGLGWGTYESRTNPSIGKYGKDTPEYHAVMADYGKKLQTALKEAGMLKAAYVYWFDEPGPNDYEFVANGFATLKKYMPEMQRMLTEEPNDPLNAELEKQHTQIDIWCPISNCYSESQAAKRMKKNERFWWYVCCGPKAPYCTLFIDHPATELRVWLWQTYERGIVGNLVWASNWWTSPTAFPDRAQNPYKDPMGYVSGGAVGSINYWGNGDGRFVYPPLAAAEPGMNDGKPVIEKPVSSIRWEILREGIEDYEMLVILRELVSKQGNRLDTETKDRIAKLLDFDPITTSTTSFTKVPKPIYDKRQELMKLIVKLKEK